MHQDEIPMATLTIRNLDAAMKERLRVRAAQHGHSMEAELRHILQDTLNEPEHPAVKLYQRIRPVCAARRRRSRTAAARAGSGSAALRLMFLLDTNILSAVMGTRPAPKWGP